MRTRTRGLEPSRPSPEIEDRILRSFKEKQSGTRILPGGKKSRLRLQANLRDTGGNESSSNSHPGYNGKTPEATGHGRILYNLRYRRPISRPFFSWYLSIQAHGAVTVSLTVVFLLRLPAVPVMVIVDFPLAAASPTFTVNVLVEVAGFGLKAAATPFRHSTSGQSHFLIEAVRWLDGDRAASAAALHNRQASR